MKVEKHEATEKPNERRKSKLMIGVDERKIIGKHSKEKNTFLLLRQQKKSQIKFPVIRKRKTNFKFAKKVKLCMKRKRFFK